MDNGRLLHDAWRLTWRHRFLWVLGLFAGGGGSFNVNTGFPSDLSRAFPSDFGRGLPSEPSLGSRGGSSALDPEVQRVLAEVGAWMLAHLGLLVGLAVAVMLLGLVFLVLHFIAQGAIIGALGRLAAGEPTTLGTAWALGRRLAWRYVVIWLLLLAGVLGLMLLIGVVAGVLVLLGQAAPGVAIGLGVILGGLALLVGLPLSIGLSVVVAYAQRAIALDDLSATAALEAGLRLVRTRLGASLILWLISLVVAIATGFVAALVALAVLLPFGITGFAAYASAGGLSAALIAVGVMGLLTLIVALWAVVAIANTYAAAYWTLGYLGLTDRYPQFPVY